MNINGSDETCLAFKLPNGHCYMAFENGNYAYLVYESISTRQYFITGTYYTQNSLYCIEMSEDMQYMELISTMNAPDVWKQHAGEALSHSLQIYT
jgi:hypothetical protein